MVSLIVSSFETREAAHCSAKGCSFASSRRDTKRRNHMNRMSLHRLRDLLKGRAMLLTNTNNAQTTVITAINGTVINGVALRGCSAYPAHHAERPSEKRARKHVSDRGFWGQSRGKSSMQFGSQPAWLDLPASMPTASGLFLGFASGRSLS